MKTLRFLATADWHADNDPKKLAKLQRSLDQMLAYVQNHKVNAIIHSGDIWERKQSYADNSGVPLVVNYLRAMSRHVDYIFITKGNNSHDEPGSVSLLHQLEPNICAYEYPVVLAVDSDGDDFAVANLLKYNLEPDKFNDLQYIVSLVPYPTKAMFVEEQSIDLNNAEFVSMFEGIFELIADKMEPYSCPKILAFHGNVVGSRLSTGQTLLSQDIMVAPATLKKAKANYYALGHIHLRQEVHPGMVYSGSIYNKNWGETEQKSFEVIEFQSPSPTDEFDMATKQIMLTSAKPMVKLEATYSKGKLLLESELSETGYIDLLGVGKNAVFSIDAEYRLRINIKENDRKLITESNIQVLKEIYGEDVKIEWDVIPDERESRSEAIMNAKTLLEEVEEYAKVVEVELPESVKEKVQEIQEGEVML